jgi:hypothetical protein
MRPISKTTRAKWTGGVVQVLDQLLCKCEALSSTPDTPSPTKRVVEMKASAIFITFYLNMAGTQVFIRLFVF